jgi:hypothetical protein
MIKGRPSSLRAGGTSTRSVLTICSAAIIAARTSVSAPQPIRLSATYRVACILPGLDNETKIFSLDRENVPALCSPQLALNKRWLLNHLYLQC